jgi:site-specific recombinase XerD
VWKVTIATANGRRARTIHGTRADAANVLDTLHEENDGPAPSLNALAARYLAHATASGRAPNTIRRYRELWRNWLAPTLGATHPHQLHPAQIEATLTAMADHGLSASSIRQTASLLARAYDWAQHTGLANYNPALASQLPNGARITIRHR